MPHPKRRHLPKARKEAKTVSPLTISAREVNGVTILDLKGTLIMGEAEQLFHDRVVELLNSGIKSLAVNLAEVTYVDSSGVGVMMRTHVSIAVGGAKWKLFGAPKQTIALLEVAQLDQVLEMYEDEKTALASFSANHAPLQP